jgi:hypothetical protein
MPIFPATQEDASSRPVWVYIVRIHLKKSGGRWREEEVRLTEKQRKLQGQRK